MQGRLIEAEGKIFALAYIVRDLLSVAGVAQEVVDLQLAKYQALMTAEETDDESTTKFKEAGRALFKQLASGNEPSRPTFTVIKGGKPPDD
jgi:hypothetical protein